MTRTAPFSRVIVSPRLSHGGKHPLRVPQVSTVMNLSWALAQAKIAEPHKPGLRHCWVGTAHIAEGHVSPEFQEQYHLGILSITTPTFKAKVALTAIRGEKACSAWSRNSALIGHPSGLFTRPERAPDRVMARSAFPKGHRRFRSGCGTACRRYSSLDGKPDQACVSVLMPETAAP